jgi:valyl-tRNA synthetase
MKVGRRLAIKVLNASKFALSFGGADSQRSGEAEGDLRAAVTSTLDLAMLAALGEVVQKATAGFEAWDYTRSLEATETFFWTFCDDYLELVKDRAYGGQGEEAAGSARAALRIALDVLLRLLAPFLPYVTEEVWSWWHDGSVHRAAWPSVDETATTSPAGGAARDAGLLGAVGEALAGIRKVKSEAKVGMRAEVSSIVLAGPAEWVGRVRAVEADLRAAGRVTGSLDYAETETPEVRDAVLIPVEKPKA